MMMKKKDKIEDMLLPWRMGYKLTEEDRKHLQAIVDKIMKNGVPVKLSDLK
jgi:aminoglycoside/choline kinase family phosphotransferase